MALVNLGGPNPDGTPTDFLQPHEKQVFIAKLMPFTPDPLSDSERFSLAGRDALANVAPIWANNGSEGYFLNCNYCV